MTMTVIPERSAFQYEIPDNLDGNDVSENTETTDTEGVAKNDDCGSLPVNDDSNPTIPFPKRVTNLANRPATLARVTVMLRELDKLRSEVTKQLDFITGDIRKIINSMKKQAAILKFAADLCDVVKKVVEVAENLADSALSVAELGSKAIMDKKLKANRKRGMAELSKQKEDTNKTTKNEVKQAGVTLEIGEEETTTAAGQLVGIEQDAGDTTVKAKTKVKAGKITKKKAAKGTSHMKAETRKKQQDGTMTATSAGAENAGEVEDGAVETKGVAINLADNDAQVTQKNDGQTNVTGENKNKNPKNLTQKDVDKFESDYRADRRYKSEMLTTVFSAAKSFSKAYHGVHKANLDLGKAFLDLFKADLEADAASNQGLLDGLSKEVDSMKQSMVAGKQLIAQLSDMASKFTSSLLGAS